MSTSPSRGVTWPLSIAPMVDRTDRHFRFFMRQVTRRALLYTEMITTGAVLRGDTDHVLAFSPREGPVALQLGGDNPDDLAACAKIAVDYGYHEIDLNVGCPSSRVQKGSFGACLMARPDVVARCVTALRDAVTLPVTVKHRIGIDGLEGYDDLRRFVDVVADAGCDRFIVHARIAILAGLSPKQNRTVPPLRYEDVHRLKQERPDLTIEINGGIDTVDSAAEQLAHVDGVMIGRAAYDDPYRFASADAVLFGDARPVPTRRQILEAMVDYCGEQADRGVPVRRVARHMLGLFAFQRGNRAFRRALTANPRAVDHPDKLREAAREIPPEVLDTPPARPPLPPPAAPHMIDAR